MSIRINWLTALLKKYNVNKLVYFEYTGDIRSAIEREKQIKGWVRAKKNSLVESVNPNWQDLSEELGLDSSSRCSSE